MALLTSALIGAGCFLAGKLLSTGKEMYRDNLISKKELEEIKAKSEAFEKLLNHHTHKIELAYNLEMRFLDDLNIMIERAYGYVDKCMDHVEQLDDNSPKIHFYMSHMQQIYNNLNGVISFLGQEGKYFNDNILQSTNVRMIDFNNETAIGNRETQEKESDHYIPGLPFPQLPKLPKNFLT